MHTTSLSLLDRLANNRDDADWQKLMLIYRPFIDRVVRGYPGLDSQADDVVQEVVLVLMRELPLFQRQRAGSFRAWLRIVTVNQLRIALRKSKRMPRTSADLGFIEQQLETLADSTSQAAKMWEEEHDRAVMQKVIEIVRPTVQEKTWMAFERYAIEEIAPEKVAQDLGMSLNSVLLAKSRVLRRLRVEAKGLVED
jgi:RNA polymerase sigma-70 factor, ECF subfamily